MKLSIVSVIALCASLATAANSTIACYSNVDWAVKVGSSQQQTPQQCLESCSGYSIIGLKNGNQCYCVKNTPSINEVATALCNMPCSGSESAICGGDSVFSVYTSNQVLNLGSSSSSNSFSSSADSSSASSSSSSTSSSGSGSESASKTASSGSVSSASTTSGSASSTSSGSATGSARSSDASSASSTKESSTSAKSSSSASSKSTSSKAMGAQLEVSVQGVIGVLAPLLLL